MSQWVADRKTPRRVSRSIRLRGLNVLQLSELLLSQVDSSDLVSHVVGLDVLPLLAETLLDVALGDLGSTERLLEHVRVRLLPTSDLEVKVGAHRLELELGYTGARVEESDRGSSEVDGRQSGRLGHGRGGRLSVVLGWRRGGRARDRDDVFESCEMDVLERVSVEEVEQHRLELDQGGVGLE